MVYKTFKKGRLAEVNLILLNQEMVDGRRKMKARLDATKDALTRHMAATGNAAVGRLAGEIERQIEQLLPPPPSADPVDVQIDKCLAPAAKHLPPPPPSNKQDEATMASMLASDNNEAISKAMVAHYQSLTDLRKLVLDLSEQGNIPGAIEAAEEARWLVRASEEIAKRVGEQQRLRFAAEFRKGGGRCPLSIHTIF